MRGLRINVQRAEKQAKRKCKGHALSRYEQHIAIKTNEKLFHVKTALTETDGKPAEHALLRLPVT